MGDATGRVGLTVAQHQQRTVDNLLTLRSLAPDLPIIPVLQGWEPADYLRAAERFAAAGVDLAAEPLVGLGSVCRRQAVSDIAALVTTGERVQMGRMASLKSTSRLASRVQLVRASVEVRAFVS